MYFICMYIIKPYIKFYNVKKQLNVIQMDFLISICFCMF